ncbi:MAG: sulfatase [Acidobacteriota bacterium]
MARNVVLYVIDTLRADRLGFHGHRRGVSPRLDALAERSIVFERAIAQSSWTKSTMASVLTGLGPLTHGIRGPEHRLGDQATTLAEQLGAAGWWTAAASTNAHLTAESGFAQGFDVFEALFDEGSNDASTITAWGLDQLDRREDDRPFFLWLHVMEPHAPYAPPETERRRFAASVEDRWLGSVEHVRALGDKATPATDEVVDALFDLYDAEIAATDRAFGALLDGLEARDLTDGTVIVVLADHGEAFRERGVFGHGWDLHAETLDVPFLVHVPGVEPRRVGQPVQQIDVLPTLVDLFGLSADPSVQGASLMPLVDGGDLAPRPLIATMDYEGRAGLAVVVDRFKWITPRSADFGPPRLYDLVADPQERRDLIDERPVLAGWLESLARRAERVETEAATVDLDPETRRRLEALGYL